jgi:hypothetical protein
MRNAQVFCIRTDHASIATFRFLGSLAQYGIKPHRKASKLRCLVSGFEADREVSLCGSSQGLQVRSSIPFPKNRTTHQKTFFLIRFPLREVRRVGVAGKYPNSRLDSMLL